MNQKQSTIDADLALAHHLADAAAKVSLAHFRRDPKSWAKADGSLVTEADLAVEDTLRRLLAAERPDDAILGEERGQSTVHARRWVIDAIDGTIDFAAGTSDWCTLIALEVDGQRTVSVCDAPAKDQRTWAARGGGAFRSFTGRPETNALRVSTVDVLADARCYVAPTRWIPTERGRTIAAALRAAMRPSPQIDHAGLQVATGDYDVAVFFLAGPWDLSAPALVVEEAGGRFTDLDSRDAVTNGPAVFSNGRLHKAVLDVIARAGG